MYNMLQLKSHFFPLKLLTVKLVICLKFSLLEFSSIFSNILYSGLLTTKSLIKDIITKIQRLNQNIGYLEAP